MILEQIMKVHLEQLARGYFPKRVYINKNRYKLLEEELESRVNYIHTLSVVITNKPGIWCE